MTEIKEVMGDLFPARGCSKSEHYEEAKVALYQCKEQTIEWPIRRLLLRARASASKGPAGMSVSSRELLLARTITVSGGYLAWRGMHMQHHHVRHTGCASSNPLLSGHKAPMSFKRCIY